MFRYSAGEELVARQERPGELRVVGRQPLLGIVQRVAGEELVPRAVVVVDAPLAELLPELLVVPEGEGRKAAADGGAVGLRERVQIRLDERIDGDRPVGQQAEAGRAVGNEARDRLAERFAQPLVAGEVEQAIAAERAAERQTELVPHEVGLAGGIEVVGRVERVVAVEFEGAAARRVRARFGEHVDLAAVVPAELRAVRVRFDAELADGLHPERRPRRASRRAVGEVVLQRAVEQIDVRPVVLPVDAHPETVRHHRAAVARRKSQDARLQEREIGEVAPIQRERFDRPGVHEIAQLARHGVDRSAPHHEDLFFDAADPHDGRRGERLAHGHLETAQHRRPESGQLGAQIVDAGRQRREDEPPVAARDRGSRHARLRLCQRKANAGQNAFRRVFDLDVQIRAGLRGGRQGDNGQQAGACGHEREPLGSREPTHGHRASHLDEDIESVTGQKMMTSPAFRTILTS